MSNGRINAEIDTNLYMRIAKLRTQIQKENLDKNISFTDALKLALERGLK